MLFFESESLRSRVSAYGRRLSATCTTSEIRISKLSTSVKTLSLHDFTYAGTTIPVVLDVLDIEKIYRSKMVGFEKENYIGFLLF